MIMELANPEWPNGARCAVALSFDNFGESYDLLRYGYSGGANADGVYAPRRGIPRILDLLERYEIPATFFLEGWNVKKYASLAKEIAERGHEIGGHGWMHETWDKLGLIQERGRQRTDSTHILAAVRRLNRLERVGETLRAAMDWSYDLLADQERLALERLAVFAGGWTLDGAEFVVAGDGIEAGTSAVLELLASLVDKSLVTVSERDGRSRYSALETVREYAWDKLTERGEHDRVVLRHRLWCLELAERAAAHFWSARMPDWLSALELEHDNLRAALDRATGPDGIEVGLRIAGNDVPAATIVLVALLVISGLQLLLFAMWFDMESNKDLR
jgi:peptidoglycan/xylan/chitin deacetylase (PgdA/CDA1 family)